MIQMDHEFHVARRAPIFHAFVEIVAKHSAPHIPVIRPGALRFGRQPAAAENLGDVGFEVVALFLLKGFEQLRRPGTDAREVGLVAAKAEDGFAKFVADHLLVGFVNHFQISVRRHGIQIVNQRVKRVLGDTAVFPIVVPGGRGPVSVADERNLPSLRACGCRPFEMSVSRQRHHGARRRIRARATATAATAPTVAAARDEHDAFCIRGQLDGERLPHRQIVTHIGVGQLDR